MFSLRRRSNNAAAQRLLRDHTDCIEEGIRVRARPSVLPSGACPRGVTRSQWQGGKGSGPGSEIRYGHQCQGSPQWRRAGGNYLRAGVPHVPLASAGNPRIARLTRLSECDRDRGVFLTFVDVASHHHSHHRTCHSAVSRFSVLRAASLPSGAQPDHSARSARWELPALTPLATDTSSSR